MTTTVQAEERERRAISGRAKAKRTVTALPETLLEQASMKTKQPDYPYGSGLPLTGSGNVDNLRASGKGSRHHTGKHRITPMDPAREKHHPFVPYCRSIQGADAEVEKVGRFD